MAATETPLARPEGVLLDLDRLVFYVADTGNGLVRRISQDTGTIEIVAGTQDGEAPTVDEKNAAEVKLGRPTSLALDGAENNLYILDVQAKNLLCLDLDRGKIRV